MPKVSITILDETREKINKAYYHHHYKIIHQSIDRDARWSGQRRGVCTNGIFRYHPSQLGPQSSVESRKSSMDSRVQSLILPRLIFLDLIFSSLLLCNTTPLRYCCVWRVDLPSLPVCRVVYPFFTTSTRLPVFFNFYPFWEFRFQKKKSKKKINFCLFVFTRKYRRNSRTN